MASSGAPMRRRAGRAVKAARHAVWGLAMTPLSCGAAPMPAPREAALAYASAAAKSDVNGIYAMLTRASREAHHVEEVRGLVASERAELIEQARTLAGPEVRVEATARLRFADGEEAALDLHQGRFWITAAGTLPGGAQTPEQALDQLRRTLARRSYPGLMRVLSRATRAAVENDLRALVEGLGEAPGLAVQVTGETAVVPVAGGHQVRLRREGGLWRVEDFD